MLKAANVAGDQLKDAHKKAAVDSPPKASSEYTMSHMLSSESKPLQRNRAHSLYLYVF